VPPLLLALLLPLVHAADQRTLMLGNSFIDYNSGIDNFLAKALEASVDEWPEVGTRRLTGPGYGLADHLLETLDAESAWYPELLSPGGDWDLVLFQDHGAIPGFGPGDNQYDDSLRSGGALNELVAGLPADTILLLTWGRLDGDDRYPDIYPDYSAMQDRLTEGVLAYASEWSTAERPVFVAPAGLGYQQIHDQLVADGQDPVAEGTAFHDLFYEDGGHPSESGSYLAACILYGGLTGRSPIGLPPPDIVPPDAIDRVQQTAHDVVFDDPFGPVPQAFVHSWARWTAAQADPGSVVGGAVWPLVGIDSAVTLDSLTVDDGGAAWLRDGGSLAVEALTLGPAGQLGLDPGADPPTAETATLAGQVRLLQAPSGVRTLLIRGPGITADGATLVDGEGFHLATDAEGLWLISDDAPTDSGAPDSGDTDTRDSAPPADSGGTDPVSRCEGCSAGPAHRDGAWGLAALGLLVGLRRRRAA